MNIVLKLAYDGSRYFGWQKTAAGPSIEEELQRCCEQILQHPVSLQAASRTDRGVHAEEQWVNFFTEKTVDLALLHKGLNALLPPMIRILSIQEMPSSFHPTLDAEKKEYHYHISTARFQLPKERAFSWHVPYPLDVEKMEAATHYFVGEHDFSSFCNSRKNLNYRHKKRLIESLSLFIEPEHHLEIRIVGTHFLYKMVRNIVGTLIYVGRGKITLLSIPQIIEAGLRSGAGVTAPAHGLTLKKIYYPQEYTLKI